jgi:hypothetical protein
MEIGLQIIDLDFHRAQKIQRDKYGKVKRRLEKGSFCATFQKADHLNLLPFVAQNPTRKFPPQQACKVPCKAAAAGRELT